MELYALACYDKETGEFVEFVRKGRSYSVIGYDNLTSAKRGLSHTKRTNAANMYNVVIVKAEGLKKITE